MSAVAAAGGTRIAYNRTGPGAPLVLIGGAFRYRRYPGQIKLTVRRGLGHTKKLDAKIIASTLSEFLTGAHHA